MGNTDSRIQSSSLLGSSLECWVRKVWKMGGKIVVVILDEIEGFYTPAYLGMHLGKCIVLDE